MAGSRAASINARETACCGARASTAYTKTLASSTPGSIFIVVNFDAPKTAAHAEIPDGQVWGAAVGSALRQEASLLQDVDAPYTLGWVHQVLQVSVNGEALLL